MHACYGCYYHRMDQSRPTGPWQQYYWSAKGRLRCYCTGLIHNNWVRWIHDAVDRAVRAEQESNRRQKKSRKRHLKQSISPAVLLRTPSCLPHPVRAYVFVLGDGNIRRTRGGTSPFERFLSLFFLKGFLRFFPRVRKLFVPILIINIIKMENGRSMACPCGVGSQIWNDINFSSQKR